jgi:trehalose 6-phosphate synthase/phosphatase
METPNRIIIVSNRLPLKIVVRDGKPAFVESEGGLATGLSSIYKTGDNLWIGWAGGWVQEDEREQVVNDMAKENLLPVFLTETEITEFYEGFSNETLWPLFHYFPSYTSYSPAYFDTYYAVNKKFAEAIIANANPGDVIWIHDYQLLLVPQMVREAIPDVSIGFFQHIPFPSYEIFRSLPWRKEILKGVLGADVIGFHTYDDVRHFISAANRIINVGGAANELVVDNRSVTVDAFPMGIDYKKYSQLTEDKLVRRKEKQLRKMVDNNKIILCIDRLDYSKGIPQRLAAYDLLLSRHPELRGKINLIQLVVPSRDKVQKYKELKEEMNRLVGEINGKYGKLGWQPIQHFYRSFPLPLLSALYKVADVALVTPMRDGMNLVSKEYVASKPDQKGVLILSETAGAARELSDALMINPNDIWDYAEQIYAALNMPEDEQKRRMANMQQTVARFDVFNWVTNFLDKLTEVKQKQKAMLTRIISDTIKKKITSSYTHAKKRLIFLDYDGTLVPFQKQVNAAVPDASLLQLLTQLTIDPKNTIVITSGRDYTTLDKWLGHLRLDVIAEHGAWYRDHATVWRSRRDLNNDWRNEIQRVMETYTRRTPGAFIEEKSYSLVWHYRRVEEGLGNLRTHELMEDIKHFIADSGLQMLHGDKVLEVKSLSVNKGKATRRWIERDDFDFIMAIGDDHTDEDTFKAMPEGAMTIKVGNNMSAANYFLPSYVEVRELLNALGASVLHDKKKIAKA